MLARLGIRQLAYDWREEHIPQFDEEVAAMKRHGIRMVAWWISPPDLNETNRKILDVVRRHGLKLQFWTLASEPADANVPQTEKVRAAAAAVGPLAEEAARLGCQVGLYNHGGWFGEPENQLQIIAELELDNVGIVYNLHHGHAHLDRFPALLERIKPHLLALNLNGMTQRGDETGRKILPIGAGERDLDLLRTIRASGYRGPIGILNHTDLDAEARLVDNLAGLDWLVKQLDGQPAGARPKMRTYEFEAKSETQSNSHAGSSSSVSNQDQRAAASELITAAKTHGDAARGAAVFASPRFACVSCHRVGSQGGTIGPELTRVGATLTHEEIAESLLWPKRKVKPEYIAWALATEAGTVHQGYILSEDAERLVLRETATGEPLSLIKEAIAERQELGTLMPEGLMASMSAVERRDLVRFLLDLGHAHATASEKLLEHAHQPVDFEYESGPIVPANWRFAAHPVNRDRLYDFYAKEADYFRDLTSRPALLPQFPGLDGARHGHWGNQNEDTWRDGRWNRMQLGSLMCGVFRTGEKVVPRGVCVRLGDHGELAACFNLDSLTCEAAWQGEFVKFSDVRHGFLDGLAIDGRLVDFELPPRPEGTAQYLGYYRHGRRVIFAYNVNGQRYFDAPDFVDGRFVRIVAPADEHPLADLTHGGPAQWPDVLETRGTLGSGAPYAIDTIHPPFENPWNALLFFGGHDFLSDGSAMLCTMQGDVWHVTGLDERLERVRWKRFASGLHHPLGLLLVEGKVHVLGRDQITRLYDLNGDDEADFYECFSQAYETSPAGHDFVCALERDDEGNYYTASGNQGLLRISRDGTCAEVLATGFRNPDGLCLLPDGSITVPCSEGEWTATSMICLVPPRARALLDEPAVAPLATVAPLAAVAQGAVNASEPQPLHFGYGGPRQNQPPQLPLVYLPRGLDNSAGGQTCVNSQNWGPLAGQLLHFSYGAGTYFLVFRDEVAGQEQGAVVPLAGDFSAGPHRGRFHPLDGQLYVTGMAGWGTYTHADGSFERVRYTGGRVQLPVNFHVHQNGVRVEFSSTIDPTVASRPERHFAQAWNYRYSAAYGSAEYAPSHPGALGHDRLAITAAHVLHDGHGVFLEIPDLQPVNQLHLRLQVDGGPPQDLFATVHALDQPFTEFPDYRPLEKTIAAHPLLADMAMLAHPPPPNPWREQIKGARSIKIEAGKNLSYTTRQFTVRAGEAVKLTFMNPDAVPHNWVLVRPGALERVGDLVNRLVADPEAALRHYVPQTDDVLAYTDIVPAGHEFTVYFEAPSTAGRYPYLCTFPGHWMVMNGQMIVQ